MTPEETVIGHGQRAFPDGPWRDVDPAGEVILHQPGSTEMAGLVMKTGFIPLFMHLPPPQQI